MIEAWAGNRRMTQKNRHLGANNPLGENRELLDLIQEAGRLGMCEYDLASGIATRTPYHDQIFGYQELQPVWTFETFLGHVLPEDRRKVDELFKHAVTSSSAIDLECRIRRIQGDVRWVWIQAKTRTDDRGKTVGLFGLIRDITDRKNTEEALRKSEALLRETQAISKTGGWEIDLSTGRVYWTDEVYRIFELPFGHDPSDIQSDLSLFSPESRPVMMHAMKRIVEQGEPYDLELEIVRPKGEKRWVRTIARPVVENNRMVRIAGNLMDITDRKLAELQLQENERNLRVMSDNSPLLIWVCDAEGRLEFVNRTIWILRVEPGADTNGTGGSTWCTRTMSRAFWKHSPMHWMGESLSEAGQGCEAAATNGDGSRQSAPRGSPSKATSSAWWEPARTSPSA